MYRHVAVITQVMGPDVSRNGSLFRPDDWDRDLRGKARCYHSAWARRISNSQPYQFSNSQDLSLIISGDMNSSLHRNDGALLLSHNLMSSMIFN